MLHGIIIALTFFACPLVWLMIVAPAIARCFGAPYKFWTLPFDRRNRSLSKWQSFWFAGVLGWGAGVFLATAVLAYFGDLEDFSKLTAYQLLFRLLTYLIAGGLLSLWMRHGEHTNRV